MTTYKLNFPENLLLHIKDFIKIKGKGGKFIDEIYRKVNLVSKKCKCGSPKVLLVTYMSCDICGIDNGDDEDPQYIFSYCCQKCDWDCCQKCYELVNEPYLSEIKKYDERNDASDYEYYMNNVFDYNENYNEIVNYNNKDEYIKRLKKNINECIEKTHYNAARILIDKLDGKICDDSEVIKKIYETIHDDIKFEFCECDKCTHIDTGGFKKLKFGDKITTLSYQNYDDKVLDIIEPGFIVRTTNGVYWLVLKVNKNIIKARSLHFYRGCNHAGVPFNHTMEFEKDCIREIPHKWNNKIIKKKLENYLE